MPAAGSLRGEELDRVIDSVVRNLNAGLSAMQDAAAAQPAEPAAPDSAGIGENEARETMADLCGHVAHALRSLDTHQRSIATYRGPEKPESAPTLNLVR